MVQSIMLIDICNVLLGLVKTKLFTVFLQVASRIYVAWLILPQQLISNYFNEYMFFAWSCAEIVRYSFYVFKDNKILLFFRYNAFIVLYPIGVCLGELPLIFQHTKNTSQIFQKYLDWVTMVIYIPAFPFMFGHMLKQRKSHNQTVQKAKETKSE